MLIFLRSAIFREIILQSSSNYHQHLLLTSFRISLKLFFFICSVQNWKKIFRGLKHNWVLNAKWILWEHSTFSTSSIRVNFTHILMCSNIISLLRKTSRWILFRFFYFDCRISSNATTFKISWFFCYFYGRFVRV